MKTSSSFIVRQDSHETQAFRRNKHNISTIISLCYKESFGSHIGSHWHVSWRQLGICCAISRLLYTFQLLFLSSLSSVTQLKAWQTVISPRSRHSRMVCLTACAEGGPLPSASSTSSAESWESTLLAGGAAEKYEAIDLVVFAFQVPTSSKAQYYGVNSNSESAATILKLDVITKHSKPLHAVASSTKKTRSLSALDQSTCMSRVYLIYIFRSTCTLWSWACTCNLVTAYHPTA